MIPHTAATSGPHPDAIEFVRFCYHRRRVGWPELYDEMCAVAGRGLFRGFSADDLGGIGIGFSLFDMPGLAHLTCRVVAEEVARRRPVSVVLGEADSCAAAVPVTRAVDPGADDGPAEAAMRVTPGAASGVESSTGMTAGTSVPRPVVRVPDGRSFDVPIRIALTPSGA